MIREIFETRPEREKTGEPLGQSYRIDINALGEALQDPVNSSRLSSVKRAARQGGEANTFFLATWLERLENAWQAAQDTRGGAKLVKNSKAREILLKMADDLIREAEVSVIEEFNNVKPKNIPRLDSLQIWFTRKVRDGGTTPCYIEVNPAKSEGNPAKGDLTNELVLTF